MSLTPRQKLTLAGAAIAGTVALAFSMSAHAQTSTPVAPYSSPPPSIGGYQVQTPPFIGGLPDTVPGALSMWLDTLYGYPRPTSREYPLPVQGTSGAWTDASISATTTAATAVPAASTRSGLHVWNVGATNTACLNFTGAATASGSGCAAGSVPLPPGASYLEDAPGNVSPEAISVVCAGASPCPLTIKVR